MEDSRLTTALDTDIGVPPKPVRRIEVLAGMAGRCVWTLEQKLALVSEMERCDDIFDFAREREVSTALLYAWRRELRYTMEAAKLDTRKGRRFDAAVAVMAGSARHWALWLTVFDDRVGIAWSFPGFGADSYCGGALFVEDQAIEVIGQIGQGEFRLGQLDADGPDERKRCFQPT